MAATQASASSAPAQGPVRYESGSASIEGVIRRLRSIDSRRILGPPPARTAMLATLSARQGAARRVIIAIHYPFGIALNSPLLKGLRHVPVERQHGHQGRSGARYAVVRHEGAGARRAAVAA